VREAPQLPADLPQPVVGPAPVLGGFGLSRALNSMFWRMTVADPLILGAISALMLVVALTAAWIPGGVYRIPIQK
jgi:hypothetical protein